MVRLKERIPIVLDKLDIQDYLQDLGVRDYIDVSLAVQSNIEEIKQYWNTNPSQRLTQVLINLGYLEDGDWWNEEEVEYLIKKGIVKFEEIYFWGVNYTKEMKRLPATVFKRLVDLEIDHIRNIYKFFENNVSTGIRGINYRYREYFEKRIKEANKGTTNELLENLFKEKE